MAFQWLLPFAARTIDLLAIFWFVAVPVAAA
jgi:hypothetical protein